MKQYEPKNIEPKWQDIWAETKLYEAVDGDATRPKYYMLTEFPYPSGAGLHAGHAREYTIGDVIARHKRMQGFNVLFPMGYDAFGLPTENFAIKNKIQPQTATAQNVAVFRKQFESLGYSFDWSREVLTTDPEYYRWTQWLFLQFFKAGLAYQAEMPINWCPKEKTGLANEEVVNGVHERCGTPVEKKIIKQWMLKITAYADRLIDGLESLDYPSRIADQQINWIGRSQGAEIDFPVTGQSKASAITVYTTRPDTLAGATFLVLAPEHPAVADITTKDQRSAVEDYVRGVQSETDLGRQETDRPKTGVFTGAYTKNPITNDKIPIWIADYVLASYGTGAIMAVPAHDERDNAFAKAQKLPIKQVIEPITGTPSGSDFEKQAIVAVVRDPGKGTVLMLDWGPRQNSWGGKLFIGGGVETGEDLVKAAAREIAEETGYTDVKFIKRADAQIHSYYFSNVKRRHDLAHMTGLLFEVASTKQVATDMDDGEKNKFLPIWIEEDKVLTTVDDFGHELVYRQLLDDYIYTGSGLVVNSEKFDGLTTAEAKSAITKWLVEKGLGRSATKYRLRDWIFSRQHYWGEPIPIIHCPKCGAVAVPDDQLPVTLPDVDHYEPTDNGESPLATVTSWVNTTCPTCNGLARRETDTMPNWAGSSWYYLRFMDPKNDKAFADPQKMAYWGMVDLYLGGMEHTTLHLLYSRFWHEFFYDLGLVPTREPYAARRGQGIVLASDGRKMSKSWGNVVNPTDVIATYGADSLRLYILFMAPYDESTPWSDERLNGVSRFLYRVWNLSQELLSSSYVTSDSVGYENSIGAFETEIDRMTHKTLKKVHDALIGMKFNTVVSTLMEYVNFLAAPLNRRRLQQENALALRTRTVRALLLMLAPAAPHLTEELWHQTGEQTSVHTAAWPEYDPTLIHDDIVVIIVQVNGKVRAQVTVPASSSDAEQAAAAQADANVTRYLNGHEVVKVVVVPRKLVNFVIK
jgi:leucyl-tRNA synthetase